MPEPPVNVRLVLTDGTEIPVDTVYVGLDEDGTYTWAVVNAPPGLRIEGMNIDELPGQSSVIIRMEEKEDE